MAQNNQNHDGSDAGWQAWFDLWRDGLAATGGAWWASPWAALTEAVWSAITEELDDDPEASADRLRRQCRQWRHDLHQSMPSSAWLTQALLTLARVPTPQAVTDGVAQGLFQDLAGRMPHLGPMQHYQARLETLGSAFEQYQKALAAYLDEITIIAERSVDALEEALISDGDLDRTNPRAIYDRWCGLAEQEYERHIGSHDYAAALSSLTNAWSELQLAAQPLIDDCLDALGMPSRRRLDDTQAALDRLRRQHNSETRALRERLAALEAQLPPNNDADG